MIVLICFVFLFVLCIMLFLNNCQEDIKSYSAKNVKFYPSNNVKIVNPRPDEFLVQTKQENNTTQKRNRMKEEFEQGVELKKKFNTNFNTQATSEQYRNFAENIIHLDEDPYMKKREKEE